MDDHRSLWCEPLCRGYARPSLEGECGLCGYYRRTTYANVDVHHAYEFAKGLIEAKFNRHYLIKFSGCVMKINSMSKNLLVSANFERVNEDTSSMRFSYPIDLAFREIVKRELREIREIDRILDDEVVLVAFTEKEAGVEWVRHKTQFLIEFNLNDII